MPSKRFPIRGGFYALADRHWSQQDLLNLIPVPAETVGTKTEFKLDSYGLRPLVDVGAGAVRGAHNVEGKYFFVSGTQLYQLVNLVAIPRGTIPGVGRVSMAHNQFGGAHQLVIDNGSARYVYNDVTLVLEKVTDASFPGSFCAFYVDQYLGFVEPQGRYWGHSDLADATDYNALDTYEAEADPDRILWAHVSHREVLIFGTDTIEPYVNAPVGDGTAPFQRAANTVIECGLGAKFSVQSMDSATFFLDDKRQVRELRGYQTTRISNAGVEEALAECSPEAIARAYAFTWQHGPHKVYYLTVPGYITFGFDLLTREWHRRSSPGKPTWRLSTLTFWNGQWVGGDASTGKLYTIDADYCFDGDEELEREYRPGVLFADQRGIEVNEIEVLVTPGNATDTVGAFEDQPTGPTVILGAPDGTIGQAYTYTYTATGGTPPYVFSLIPGESLPTGWALSSAGVMTCTSPLNGTVEPPIRVTDANGLWDNGVDELLISDGYMLLTNRVPYEGSRVTLSPGGSIGWVASVTDGVAVSPDGVHAVGFNRDGSGVGLEFRKYSYNTDTWSALTAPAVNHDRVIFARWHPDGTHLAVGRNYNDAKKLSIYALSGDTLTAIASPSGLGGATIAHLDWHGDRLYGCNVTSGANQQIFMADLTAGAMGAVTLFGGSNTGQDCNYFKCNRDGTLAIAQFGIGAGSMYVFDLTTTPPTRGAALALPGVSYETISTVWSYDSTYLVSVGNVSPNYTRIFGWDGAALTYTGPAASQLPGGNGANALAADVTYDGKYLVAACAQNYPVVYDLQTATPTLLAAPGSAGASVIAVSWTRAGETE